jgi:deoxycytidylate deaminase
MFERWTDRARKVMALANQEAQRFNHEYIGTEHALLGIVKEGGGVAAFALKNLGIDLRKVRLEVEKLVKSGPEMVTMGKLPQTPLLKKALEYAVEDARSLGHNYLGTEHLLLGLLRLQDNIASMILMNLGVTVEKLREEILNMLKTANEEFPPQSEWSRRPTWTEYFMLEATSALSRSPDPSTKHGAVIVNERKRPVGQGYNGFPSGGDESMYPTTRPEKYVFIIHAEANAVLNCTFPPDGCTLYVTGVPCNNCMKYIIQAGIKKVVYGKIGSNMVDKEEFERTKMMARNHDVTLVEYNEVLSPYQWHLQVAEYLKGKGWT